jgi:predicted esterase
VTTSTARERADVFLKMGNSDSALVYLRLWTSANPRDTTALVTLSKLLAQRNQHEAALDALASAAAAGFGGSTAIALDSTLAPLCRNGRGRAIAERIEANAREQSQYPARFARQERIGRYRVLYPPQFDSLQRYHLVLLLHGNGNEPIMMLRWAKALGLKRAIVVCPEAPYVKVAETIAQGRLRLSAAGEDLAAPDTMNPTIVELSARWYMSVLDDAERSLPVVRASLPVVVGFSQGGFYAQVLVSRYPERFRAAVLLAPSYYSWGGIADRLDGVRRYGIEILHVHGRSDPIVPIQTGWLIADMYRRAEIPYTLLEFNGEHWIPDDLTTRVGRWIEERFR